MKTMNITFYWTRAVLLIVFLLSTTVYASALTTDTGYWVVENNTITRDFTVVKFYNSVNQLMYEERLEGVYLDVKKKKHVKMLNKTLKMIESNRLIASQMKGYGQALIASLAKERK